MCENCIKTVANINPKLIAMAESVKDEMDALHAKIAPQMREIMQMVVVNSETGETTEEGDLPAEAVAEIEALQAKIAGVMGLSYVVAWFSIRQATSQTECHTMGDSIMNVTNSAIVEASAYNYVFNQAKH